MYRKHLENIKVSDEHESIQAISLIKSTDLINKFQKRLHQSAEHYSDLWDNLLNRRPSLQKVKELCRIILQEEEQISKKWDFLVHTGLVSPTIGQLFSGYASNVKGDFVLAREINIKYIYILIYIYIYIYIYI